VPQYIIIREFICCTKVICQLKYSPFVHIIQVFKAYYYVKMKKYYRVKEERNKLYAMKRRKASWIGLILFKICHLKHVIEGKTEGRIEVMGRLWRICKKILDDLWNIRVHEIERGNTTLHSMENSILEEATDL